MQRVVPGRLRATGQALFSAVVFGAGKVETLGRELSRRGAKRALIVTGKTLGRSKLLDKVKSAAGSALAGVFAGAAQHVPSQTVTELVAEARRAGFRVLPSGNRIEHKRHRALRERSGTFVDPRYRATHLMHVDLALRAGRRQV